MPWVAMAAGLAVLALCLIVYGAWRRKVIDRRFPPTGGFASVGGVSIHMTERGAGRPVVFLHSNFGDGSEFTFRLLDRAATDFHGIVIDRPGHGHSARPRQCDTLPDQLQILREVAAPRCTEPPLVVAHSWSALLGLSWALDASADIAALVLVNPLCYPAQPRESTDARVQAAGRLGAIVASLTTPVVGLGAYHAATRAKFAPEPVPRGALVPIVARRLWRPAARRWRMEDGAIGTRETPALNARFGDVAVPVVIMVGDQDRVATPARHGYRLHNQIRHSRLLVEEDAGHMVHMTRPDAVMRAMHLAWDLALATETERVTQRIVN